MQRIVPLCVALGLASCVVPVRAIGVVRPGLASAPDQMTITSTEGRSRPLVLQGESAAMRFLDGHEVELEGTFRRGAIHVERWQVTEGINGLPVWVGEVRAVAGGHALYDRRADTLFALDRSGGEALADFVGREVLVEGYIAGTMTVHVVYFRPLFDEHSGER